MEATTFLLLMLLAGTLGGPVKRQYQNDDFRVSTRSTECSTYCTGSNKFAYQVGKVYQYQYETTTLISLHGVTDGAARANIKATVSFSVLSKCEMSLSLSDVIITSTEPDQADLQQVNDLNFKSALESNTLRFSFQDGRIEDLCPSDKEETISLNFKRGILTAFQNSMNQHDRDESLKEVDVTGLCPTEYKVMQKGWKSSEFTKSKDLLGCSDRHDYRTSLQSTTFRLPDTIQSLPLLKGSHKCTQSVAREGFVQSSTCTESLVFRPFSKQEAGARTESTQKLIYTMVTDGALPKKDPVGSKATLLFEHKQAFGSNDQTLWSARQKLTELCRITVQDIPSEVPGLFADLVYLMRNLDTQQILDIADRVQRGNICEDNKKKAQKFFQDALPMVGTSSAIEVMTGMLLSQEVTGTQADIWITSLHFVHYPTVDMLKHLKSLLLSESYRTTSLLPVTTLVNKFCRSQSSCSSIQEVGDIVDALNDILGSDCQSTEENLILMTLRAIGNLGYADAVASTLEKCVKSTNNDVNTRIMSVQAFRGLSCSVGRKTLMGVFMDVNEDSELRIAAYLGVMQCWDETVISQVRKVLEKEEVNQVGSFVWTHLTNLMGTPSPNKQALKDILNDENLQKVFNLDRRKYSRNYELSFFSEKFGTGAMAESNLIWSSKSFMPRSVMVNLTVDMLGHSVNLFEIGGRIQGLETWIQNYFGARGVFKGGDKPKDNVPSRYVKQEKMDSMKKKFAVDKDELSASLYLRMFGNDLGFHHFDENELTSLQNKFSGKDILTMLAKEQDISFTQSAMFIDSSVSVPTVTGMALSLSVNGTATIELIASGKMDLRKFSLKKMEANFDIRPSGAVQLSGMMSLDAGTTRAGLKMVTTLHTSTSVSGILDLTNGQVLSVELDTPKRNMDILDVKSEFFLIHNKKEAKQEVTRNKQMSKTSCSPESVLKVLGYELCGAVSFINATGDVNAPYFPFTGPVTAAVTLHKKDAPRGFRLLGKLIQNKATSIAQLSFDTPGSLVERAINVGYFLDTQVRSVELELNSPWKKVLLKGSYNIEPRSRKLLATVIDDGREYIFQIQLDQDKQQGKTIYTPTLEISRPRDSKFLAKAPEKLSVGGSITIEDDYSDINGIVSIKHGLDPDPIELKGNYVNKEKQNTLSGSVTLNQKTVYSATFQVLKNIEKGKIRAGKIEPTILISAPSWRPFLLSGAIDFKEDKNLIMDMMITMDKTLKQALTLNAKVTKQKRKATDRFLGEASFNSQFGTANAKGSFDVSSDLTKKGLLLVSKVNMDYNLPILENKDLRKNKLTLNAKVYDKSAGSLKKYDVNLNVDSKNYPDASFVSNFELSRRESFTKAVLAVKTGPKAKFTSDKSHELRLELAINHKLDSDSAEIGYGLQVLYPIKNIEYEIKGKHEHQLKNKFFFETYTAVVFGKGKSVELRVIGNNNSKKSTLDASGSLELNFPAFEIDGRNYNSRSYKLGTSIIQNADKEYIHTINLQINNDDKHTLVTKFKRQQDGQFDLYSQLQIAGNVPAKLTVSASHDPEVTKGLVEFLKNNDKYSGALNFQSQGDKHKIYSWDFIWPERRVKGSLEGGQKQPQSAFMKFDIFWDADKDPTQKIALDSHYSFELGKKIQKSDIIMTVTTPFVNHKIYSFKRQIELTVREFKDEFAFIWQKQENELSYSFWLLLGPSPERLEMKTKVVTPIEALRKFGIEIMHKFDGSRYLSSSIKGAYNDDELTVAVLIANTGDTVRNNLDSSFSIVSTLPTYRSILLKLRHSDDGRVYSTEVSYERNGDQYKLLFDTTYFRIHYQVHIDSKLQMFSPSEKPVIIKWVHANTLTNLNSTVSFNWRPGYDTKFDVGIKFNTAEKDYALDITLSGPWKQFKDFELQFKHNMLIDVSGSYLLRINKDPSLMGRGAYKYTDSELSGDFYNANGQGVLKAQFGQYPFTLLVEQTWRGADNSNRWEEKKIVLDASVDKQYSDGWSANAKLVTPWEEVQNVNIRGNLKKTSASQWKVDSAIILGIRKQITADFTVDTAKWAEISGEIKTPYKEMNSVNFGYSTKEINKAYNTDMFLEMQPIFNKVQIQQSLTVEPDFSTRYYFDLPDTEIKSLEININHFEQRRGCNTLVNVKYGSDKEINLNFNGKFNKNKFPENTKVTVALETPFDILPNLNVHGELDKDDGIWTGTLDLTSEAKEFSYLLIKLKQANSESSFYSDVEVESSLAETVVLGMHFDWGDVAAANLTLKAPSIGRTMVGFKQNSKSFTDFQHKIFAEFGGSNMDMDIGLKHDENMTKCWVLYAYPGSDDSYLKTSIHRIGNTAHDFDVGGFLQVGRNSRPYNISMQYAMVETKTALGTTLETPFTKSLSYLVKNEKQQDREHSTILYGKYGQGYLIDLYSAQRITEQNVNIDTRGEYLFEGKGHKSGTKVLASWSEKEQEGKVEAYYNDNWTKAQLNRKTTSVSDSERTETIDLLVFTPYESFTDVGTRVVVNIKSNQYTGTCSLEYMDENEAVLTFDLTQPNENQANLEATLTLPVDSYYSNTLSYRHSRRADLFTADLEIETGKGEHLDGKLEFKNNQDYTLTLTGPVEQFESFVASGKFNEQAKQISGNAQLLLALNSNPTSLEYDIKVNDQPAILKFKLRSPFENFQNADLVIEHNGVNWKQFKNKAVLNSESIGNVNSDTTWRFSSLSNFEGKTTLTSSVANMENLKLNFSTKDSSGSQISNLKVGWHTEKEISMDSTWSVSRTGDKTKFSTNLGIATPFNNIKSANIKLSHLHSDQLVSESVALSHNGQSYLDADLSYIYEGKNEAAVEIRSPRPMSLVVTGSATKELLDGTVNFKWDKRSPEAHIEIVTSLADRSEFFNIDKEFKFKVIHPVRIMGLDCLYKKANNEILSSGLLTWDEQNGNSFSYDLSWINRTSVYSQMYDGHVKLGVPQRSVKMQGSYSDSGSIVTASSAVWWDADSDEKKKVTMSTSVETRENLKRVGLNINLPYINKQLNLDGTTKGGYGSTISDSRAEISYSSDPKKLIVVTSKISNLEMSSAEDYNYTMDIGFEHPVTDINFQLSSHLGSVGRTSSFGSQVIYLTANKERKTVAFYAKADRGQRNVEVKVVTPLKMIGIEGQLNSVSNRHHMLLKSFEDDKQALKLNVLVDPRRRNMDIEFNYDQDDPNKMVKFTGHYVNDSAIRVDMISQDGRQTTSESMIAVRLNTSHILHTRILWRPTLLQEMQTFVGTKVTAFSYAANDAFTKAVDSVGSEVKAKYLLVSSELRSEMSQVFQLMEKEMESLNIQMETLKTEFRRFYQRNDLHIRDLGEQVKAAFDGVSAQVQDLVKSYRAYSVSITKATNEWLMNLKAYPIAQNYGIAIEELTSGLKSMREVLENALNEVAVELNKFSAVSYRQYLEITRAIDRKLNSYTRTLNELPIYRAMMEQKRYMEKLGSKTVPGWTHIYNSLYLSGQQMLQDQYHDLMSRPEFQHMHAVATEIHQQIMQWNLEQTMNAAVQRIMDLSKNLILIELTKLRGYLIDIENSRVIVYDPERGELQFEIHVPFPVKSLAEAPEIKVEKYLNPLKRWIQLNIPSTNYSTWDTYYDYVPSLEPLSYLPPFEANAFLIGGQHYITFDETHFDFLSTCSHVLTRDMMNDNFSVVINYEQRSQRDGVKSLSFTIENSLTFEILSDYKLEVNGRETEMPFISDRVKIVREGDFIRVEYAGGLEVLCNPKLELYKVTLNGWYHGQVAGLLGKFDNEAVNDKMINQETQNFEVSRRTCLSKNLAVNPDPALDLDSMCTHIFDESSSKFRPCFKQVDTAPFVRMCQIYMAKMTENEAIHLVTEQYRYVCQSHGVFVGPLKDYVPCSNEDSFVVEGIDPLYQMADVLFVVEDSICNQWATTSLTSMVTQINNVLTTVGFKDNRFGLLGYGGLNSEDVSARTINGQHFGEASLFLKAVETMRLPNTTESGDLASAVRSAIAYPFRPGVAKILIVAPCSSCEVSFLERNLGAILSNKGFTVHVLQQQGYSYEDGNSLPKKYRIYGVDNSKIFANVIIPESVQVKDVQGTGLSDYCSTLAESTNGSLFDTTHLSDRNNIQREFIQTFALRVGWGTKLPPCQSCKCIPESGLVECQLCNSELLYTYLPWKGQSLVEAIGSLHDFNYELKTFFGSTK